MPVLVGCGYIDMKNTRDITIAEQEAVTDNTMDTEGDGDDNILGIPSEILWAELEFVCVCFDIFMSN